MLLKGLIEHPPMTEWVSKSAAKEHMFGELTVRKDNKVFFSFEKGFFMEWKMVN